MLPATTGTTYGGIGNSAGAAATSLFFLPAASKPKKIRDTMNKIIAAVSFDSVALAAVAMASTLTIGEAYMRTSLVDADSAKEARYPPLSSFITEGELM